MPRYSCKTHGEVEPQVRDNGHGHSVNVCPICRRAQVKYKMTVPEIREAVIVKYGAVCSCCGERMLEFLVLDHVNGGGRQERKGLSPRTYWSRLLREDRRDDMQVLCANCNMAKELPNGCPHQIALRVVA